jgi:hypothetical protein
MFTLIEWVFLVLVYLSFGIHTSKKAKNPKVRAEAFSIGFVAGFLQMIFLLMNDIYSMAFVSFTFLFVRINGIKNCIKEVKKKNEGI